MTRIKRKWMLFWMKRAGLGHLGRLSTMLATWFAPAYKDRMLLANCHPNGFVDPSAVIRIEKEKLHLGKHVYIGDRCVFYQAGPAGHKSGSITLGDRVHLYRDVIMEIGNGGSLFIGSETHIQPRCQLTAYLGNLHIGSRVEIAPNCAFYPYNHGFSTDEPIRDQALFTKGGIGVGDGAWLGFGVIVLDGVTIGNGAVVGAGSTVTKNIPDNAIAVGAPARVVGMRNASSTPS
jgi:acetyltransferase-like isoleucine patch superfamily enzyme